MPNMSRASRATLRSQSGPQAAAWLTAVPTSPATTLLPVLFQICLRRRLRLPLMLSNRRCEGCRAILDSLGDHRAACSVSGRLRRRAKPIELAWSAVFTEAGAVVADQVLLRGPNIEGIAAGDSRQIDFVALNVRGFFAPYLRRCHYCRPTASRWNTLSTRTRHRWSKFPKSGGG